MLHYNIGLGLQYLRKLVLYRRCDYKFEVVSILSVIERRRRCNVYRCVHIRWYYWTSTKHRKIKYKYYSPKRELFVLMHFWFYSARLHKHRTKLRISFPSVRARETRDRIISPFQVCQILNSHLVHKSVTGSRHWTRFLGRAVIPLSSDLAAH